LDGGKVVVIDRGSANGTYVNSTDSARVDQATLRNGDRIYLGKSRSSVLAYRQ
jgi:pSer/pThr/pTyr-binding forkhead associated (FHA) protein